MRSLHASLQRWQTLLIDHNTCPLARVQGKRCWRCPTQTASIGKSTRPSPICHDCWLLEAHGCPHPQRTALKKTRSASPEAAYNQQQTNKKLQPPWNQAAAGTTSLRSSSSWVVWFPSLPFCREPALKKPRVSESLSRVLLRIPA